ncbi:bacterioferritin-associated ferredoxin [Halomonadaceae bacterium KBTZ08]
MAPASVGGWRLVSTPPKQGSYDKGLGPVRPSPAAISVFKGRWVSLPVVDENIFYTKHLHSFGQIRIISIKVLVSCHAGVVMYVCVCNQITDHEIRRAVEDGCSSMRQLRNELGVATQCGRCGTMARDILNEHRESVDLDLLNALARPA